jgi:hypothetical protein
MKGLVHLKRESSADKNKFRHVVNGLTTAVSRGHGSQSEDRQSLVTACKDSLVPSVTMFLILSTASTESRKGD